MFQEYTVILVFLAFALFFIGINLLIGKLLRPNRPNPVKGMNYECGEEPVGESWLRFNNRFYVIALVFIIFEVELAVILPVGMALNHFTELGMGKIAFFEILVFAGILGLGLVYVWSKGDLEWVRPVPPHLERVRREMAERALAARMSPEPAVATPERKELQETTS